MIYKNVHHDEQEQKKTSEEGLPFTSFNVQSSAFFNHHLSSRSSDFTNGGGVGELASDFLQMRLKTQQSKISNRSSQRKSFDFGYDQNEILKKPKNNSNNDFYAKYHSNSENVHNYGNYVLKSDIKKTTKCSGFNNERRQNDNPVLKYYGASHAFFRTSSNITNGNSLNNDKNIFGLGDIGSVGGDESEPDSEDEQKGNDSNGNNMFITNRAAPAFNLNYLNSNTNNNQNLNLNQNIEINTSKTFTKEKVLNLEQLDFKKNEDDDDNENIENKKKNLEDDKNNNPVEVKYIGSNNDETNRQQFTFNKSNITNIPNIDNINTFSNTIQLQNVNPNYQEILINARSLIQDQSGCRFLQKKIDEDNQITNSLFAVLFNDIITMCTDSFGNYLIQKMLETMTPINIEKFTQLISLKFSFIAISTYGTRVIQKLLEVLSVQVGLDSLKPTFDSLNNLIINNIVQLSSDSNSSHIIIKYVNVIKYPYNIPLFESVYSNFIPLCKDKHGCCVIQKCIEAGSNEQKEKLFHLSNSHCEELISDQFGNYVIQFVVGINCEIINKYIVNVIMGNLVLLCKEKYASNVIEKFLYNKSAYSKIVLDTIIKDENLVHELILDQYGNYIVQRILMIIIGEPRMKVIQMIVKWYDEIKMVAFGPRLIAKLSERYAEFNILIGNRFGNTNYNNNNSNIGNVNFIQLNNYMFPPTSPEAMGMYMKMMNPNQQQMYHKMMQKQMPNQNQQFIYPPPYNPVYQQQFPFNNYAMKKISKGNQFMNMNINQ